MNRWMRPAASVVALAGCLWTSGCYKATFINTGMTLGEEHSEWNDFFLWGLVGKAEVDAHAHCKGEVAQIVTGGNGFTVLVSVVTLGIYAPRRVVVTCSGGAGAGAPATAAAPVTASAHLRLASMEVAR